MFYLCLQHFCQLCNYTGLLCQNTQHMKSKFDCGCSELCQGLQQQTNNHTTNCVNVVPIANCKLNTILLEMYCLVTSQPNLPTGVRHATLLSLPNSLLHQHDLCLIVQFLGLKCNNLQHTFGIQHCEADIIRGIVNVDIVYGNQWEFMMKNAIQHFMLIFIITDHFLEF